MAPISIQKGYEEGIDHLRELDRPELESRLLITEVSGISEVEFYADPDRLLTRCQQRRFHRLITRRKKGFPIAYLTKKKEFWSLDFHVGPAVLIPRPETEILVEQVIEVVDSENPIVFDVGTGSGNIAVAIARELPKARIYAFDISRAALKTARRNARLNKVSGLTFIRGDLLSPLKKTGFEGKADVIVSNPPYVTRHEWESLPPDIREHEPKNALVSGETGLEIVTRLVAESRHGLKPGGYLIMEIGSMQKDAVLRLLKPSWVDIHCIRDLSGLPRVCRARRK